MTRRIVLGRDRATTFPNDLHPSGRSRQALKLPGPPLERIFRFYTFGVARRPLSWKRVRRVDGRVTHRGIGPLRSGML